MRVTLLIILLVLLVYALPCFAARYKVVRVVDGDTIDINYRGKKERIRLLNVDTPESVHPYKTRNTQLGKQASDYTKKRLSGKFVSLEFEEKKRGKYGRLLAYVILDKKNFNLELVLFLVFIDHKFFILYSVLFKNTGVFLNLTVYVFYF